jgi:hypothetical protein
VDQPLDSPSAGRQPIGRRCLAARPQDRSSRRSWRVMGAAGPAVTRATPARARTLPRVLVLLVHEEAQGNPTAAGRVPRRLRTPRVGGNGRQGRCPGSAPARPRPQTMTEPLPEPLSAAATGPPSRRGHPSPRRRGPPEGLPEATGRNQELHAQAHQEGTCRAKSRSAAPRQGARSPPAGRTRAAASRPGGPPAGGAAAAPGRHRVPGPRPVPRHHQGRKPQGGGNRGSKGQYPCPVCSSSRARWWAWGTAIR